jgi:(1->4)-alpha-D-glucan 1-alpha-D-glucosylmutase
MICGGDEIGRTQRGNNNAYCQDNETSWLDWHLDGPRRELLAFTRHLVALRRQHPALQRDQFFRGREIRGASAPDRIWLRHDGQPMTDADWTNPATSSLAMLTAGSRLEVVDESGAPLKDDDLLFMLNASPVDLEFRIPALEARGRGELWSLIVDTAHDGASERVEQGQSTKLPARSFKLFARRALGPGGLEGARGVPTSTYRLQLSASFGFRDAAAIVDYLDRLGVGGVYMSPVLRAEAGSTHGYNVVDHSTLNPELGTDEDFDKWTEALAARGIERLADFVPNHVGIGSGENAWWTDVLENGPSSTYADFFDIEWHSRERALRGKALLPVLGRQFGQEVDDGKIGLVRDGGALWVTYYEKRFPASPRSYGLVLEQAIRRLALPDEEPGRLELESIAATIRHLPAASTTDAFERREREREKEVAKRRIEAVCAAEPEVANAIDEAIRTIATSPERLERFLAEQNYRLSFWRVATDEINYRRFFDVNDLAAIRMEDPAVFAATHRRVLDLLARGRITGLRLDHTDGLYDPQAYFQALQDAARKAMAKPGHDEAAPLYVLAEKILEPGEALPRAWAISGTTGYDFLSAVNVLWVDPASERAMTQLYARIAGDDADYRSIEHQAKRDVMDETFSGEIHVLAYQLKRIAESSRHAQDFTLTGLLHAIQEVVAALDVYRTYVRPDGSREASDSARIERAVARARWHNPMVEPSLFDFVHEVLLLEQKSDAAVRFTMRFQQLTGPIMAKGVEDTALYRYNRLVSLNDVGCDPARYGANVAAFHTHNAATLAQWPLTMTTTTTHDTKRSEDVRARLAVLSEAAEAWDSFVERVEDLTRDFVATVEDLPAPSGLDRFQFLQAVVGAWPFEGLRSDGESAAFAARLRDYMAKAVHEAKGRSSWTHPKPEYDGAVGSYVERALALPAFVEAVGAFAQKVATHGATNSLAQLALRMASPGVPDVYQGCEMWDLSLVDPDNRRPVDYARRRSALGDLAGWGAASQELARELVRSYADGRMKLHVTRTALALRRRHPALFLEGAYDPIDAGEHIVSFERSLAPHRLVCVVPRLVYKLTRGAARWALGEVWGDRRLTLGRGGQFTNVMTGDKLDGTSWPLARVLADFPVAWLLDSGA